MQNNLNKSYREIQQSAVKKALEDYPKVSPELLEVFSSVAIHTVDEYYRRLPELDEPPPNASQ